MPSSTRDPRLLTVLGVYALVVFSGLKSFALWDQVRLQLDADPLALLVQGHAHALRFLVVQPAVMAARLGVDPDPLWSLCCVLLVLATALLVARTAALWTRTDEVRLRAPALASLAAVSLFMNGRLIPAFAGVALALAVLAERRAGEIRWTWAPALVLALLLASVSSGTLAVTVVAAVLAWLAGPVTSRWLGAGIAVVGMGLVAAGAWKAMEFFHWDFLAAMSHGPGGLVAVHGVTVTAVTVALLLGAVGTWAWVGATRPIRLVVLAAVGIGLLGWSTLAVGLVPALVLLLVWAGTEQPE